MAGISAKNNAVAQLPPELPGPLPAADIRQAGGPSERRAAGGQPPLEALRLPGDEYNAFSTDEDQCPPSSGMKTNAVQDSLMPVQSGFLPSTTK